MNVPSECDKLVRGALWQMWQSDFLEFQTPSSESRPPKGIPVMCQKWIFEIVTLEQNGEHFSKTVFSADFKYVIKIPENSFLTSK